jgi:glycosyltransferase involved in cell wall biosynthesis
MWFTSNLDPTQPSSLTQKDIDRITASTPTVRFLGYQDHLVDLYRQADIVCIPTYYREGLPTAILEAAAIGRPIVSCNNVGGREFLRQGMDGILVPPQSPPHLAAALEQMIRDPKRADWMRTNAHRRFLEGYTKQIMLERTIDVIAAMGFDLPSASGRPIAAHIPREC